MNVRIGTPEFDAICRAAEARADTDVDTAIDAARANVARGLPEIGTADDAKGAKVRLPVRQMAVGMLAFIEESRALQATRSGRLM